MVTTHELPVCDYSWIKALVEEGAEAKLRDLYSLEPGKHVSNMRRYDDEPANRGTHALPCFRKIDTGQWLNVLFTVDGD